MKRPRFSSRTVNCSVRKTSTKFTNSNFAQCENQRIINLSTRNLFTLTDVSNHPKREFVSFHLQVPTIRVIEEGIRVSWHLMSFDFPAVLSRLIFPFSFPRSIRGNCVKTSQATSSQLSRPLVPCYLLRKRRTENSASPEITEFDGAGFDRLDRVVTSWTPCRPERLCYSCHEIIGRAISCVVFCVFRQGGTPRLK